jgi:isoquinoline 1-oxidoreductase subunit beta
MPNPIEGDLRNSSQETESDLLSRSRRGFLKGTGTVAGALVLGFGVPVGLARAQAVAMTDTKGTHVPAFLEIRPDNSVLFRSPFIEGGQGTFTAMAQIVGEELDADPASFVIESAPPGPEYVVLDSGARVTGGSMSIRLSYARMRRLGALARDMLLEAGSRRLTVPKSELTTRPGQVVHTRSGRAISYGALASAALALPIPDPNSVELRDPSQFRWIGKPFKRLDVHEKATGQAKYSIDVIVDGMLHSAVQHAPRFGMTVRHIRNADQVSAMKGVHSVHQLDGAVAVVAQRWWTAKRAAEALLVDWQEPEPDPSARYMPADFSTESYRATLEAARGGGEDAETVGNLANAFASASKTISATYSSHYVNHAQLEPPSALARFSGDNDLEVWFPNQAQDMFLADIAKKTGISATKIKINTPLIGGFFGRHFLYPAGSPVLQAIQLAKAVNAPVKVIWSREEEFLRDPLRPMAVVKFRAGLDSGGFPVALEAISATEGPTEGIANKRKDKLDPTALEGLTGKAYNIPNRRIAQLFMKSPLMLSYWRSVGNSHNDFLYESFLDEVADAAGKDPLALRAHLLLDNRRLSTLLAAVVDLSGGWQRGPYTASDGTRRARGIAMASPFGSFAAAIAEVSIENGQVKVHEVWEALDPGSVVNPAIVEAQMNGAIALGLSTVLFERSVYENGMPVARNYDLYPILRPEHMPRVNVRIVESGEKMGGVGEPPLPAVLPAVANAVSHLTGQRIRSTPLSQYAFNA